ncbi:hypothetical protein [Paracidovorax anthurii]|uniref:Uncharacterized protein n=1 Tax=Paracidovorax anthurii TaxID=78229 RepID=A0A328Z744_9BURK|nr:hypothetical protein [Paracidovorax anthurii]RAR81015.1 hypothetical protein AX018_102131 [Paracidovorax anthurii]
MAIHYTVRCLLETACGSLAEIELIHPDLPDGHASRRSDASRWLWIEGATVQSLQVIGDSNPSERIFDRAVLTLGGAHGELHWPSGRRDVLSINAARELRPEFRRLVHEHLN